MYLFYKTIWVPTRCPYLPEPNVSYIHRQTRVNGTHPVGGTRVMIPLDASRSFLTLKRQGMWV